VPDNGRYPGQNYLLQPLRPELKGKKTLVLDLDETLVHSSFKYIPDADFEITIELAGALHRVYVRKRPGVHRFLEHVARRWEVVIFTASLAKYADPLLDVLDRTRVIDARLFRESCVRNHDSYVKDLSMLGRRMQDTTIIDNSPLSYMFQPNYAIPITTWFSDPDDRQLYDLLPFLDALADAPDVADVLYKSKLYFASGGYIPPANGQIPGLPPMGLANYYDDEEFTPAADETAAFTNGYAGGSSQHYAVPVQPPPPPPMPAPPRAPLPPPPYTVPAVAPPPPPVAVDDDGAVDDSGGNETPSGGSESQNHALPDVPIHA
jgi:Dullard-like phosphatase family protein